MSPLSLKVAPLGAPNPPNEPHSVSMSLPTWKSVEDWGRREQWIMDSIQTCYPRFAMQPSVQRLIDAVWTRLSAPEQMDCLIFPSADASTRCIATLAAKHPNEPFHSVSFFLARSTDREETQWTRFFAVLYPKAHSETAMSFWKVFGDGISSRHADYCLNALPWMDSDAKDPEFQTVAPCSQLTRPAPQWTNSATVEKEIIKERIARLVSSDQPGRSPVTSHDIFLFPKGMCAIAAVARALSSHKLPSEAVVYGWPYAETHHCVEGGGYEKCTLMSAGSEQELDELESSLAAGRRIQALFCEVPSNPQLRTPNLQRIHALSSKYNFMVACDETLGSFVNVDLLPYVDVVVTSLTKIFSGVCNVMGGSAVLNSESPYYTTIHSALTSLYEDIYFPLDAITMANNSADFELRAHRCNDNALSIAHLLMSHPAVERVNYPSLAPSRHLYDQVRRKNGGYGFLLSIIFHQPENAVIFYDALDLCKGPSLGTNFSLAIPYSILAHFHEQEWAEINGVDRHMVRISVGVEKKEELLERVKNALDHIIL